MSGSESVPDGTALSVDPEILDLVRFDAAGLVAVVIQDAGGGGDGRPQGAQ